VQALVSIIIPTYNRAHLIGETLESVQAQTYRNWECIVVDDGSTDATDELIELYCEKDSRIQYHHRPVNRPKGANSCRNYGFEISKGDYINWFDDDDIMHPDKLEIQLQSLVNSIHNFSVCQTTVFLDKINNIQGFNNHKIISDQSFYDYLTMEIGWLTQAPLWEKNFLDNFEYLFDEELQGAQEWEFHLRVLNKFPEYAKIDESMVFIRKHSQSITYSKKIDERFYHYFLARLKIYRNENIYLNQQSIDFLNHYLLNSYKSMVRQQNPFAVKTFWRYVLGEHKMSNNAKLCAFLSIWSYLLLNRGNIFMKRIKYMI